MMVNPHADTSKSVSSFKDAMPVSVDQNSLHHTFNHIKH